MWVWAWVESYLLLLLRNNVIWRLEQTLRNLSLFDKNSIAAKTGFGCRICGIGPTSSCVREWEWGAVR